MRWRGDSGQAVLLLVAAMAAVVVGAVFLGGVARGIGKGGREQRAADLGALAGARAMREVYTRLFEPPDFAGQPNARHLEVGPYKDLGRDAALGVARANGARDVEVEFPDGDTFAPTQIRVTVRDPATSDAGGHHHEAAIKARAEAELAPPAQIGAAADRRRRRVPGPVRVQAGQADASRHGDCLRPHERRRAQRRHRADHRVGVPQQRRAGQAVRRPSRPEVGGPTGEVAAPTGHRARPRPGLGLRVAGRKRAPLRLHEAVFAGSHGISA